MHYQGKLYKVVVFDVDGTLTTTKSGATFRKTADDWQWLPGRLARLKEIGKDTHIGIATNQGGVAIGYFSMGDIIAEMGKMCEEVPIAPKGFAACFTHPKASIDLFLDVNDDRRKPGPGMIEEVMAAFMFPVDPSRCLMVGDREEDRGAAEAAGCAFAWAHDFFEEVQS